MVVRSILPGYIHTADSTYVRRRVLSLGFGEGQKTGQLAVESSESVIRACQTKMIRQNPSCRYRYKTVRASAPVVSPFNYE